MPTTNPPARPRRFAKACDACYRSKIRCLLPSEEAGLSCTDCTRRGVKCVFTRVERDLKKPRRTARQLEVVTARLQRVEALLAGEQQRSNGHDEATEPAATQAAARDSTTATNENEAFVDSQPPPEIIHDLLAMEQQEQFDTYFAQLNHVFPIFDRNIIFARLLEPSTARAEKEAIEMSKNAILVLTARMRALSEPISTTTPGNADRRDMARKCLETAMKDMGSLVMAEPSIATIQALLVSSLNMLYPPHTLVQASSLLATAIRHAHMLNLHVLNTVSGISAADRLARIRLFWCLYISDMDLSIRLRKPPMLVDEDIFVLEPRQNSDDGLGLVVSLDGAHVLNLFTARQRLARVQRQMHTRLHTFMAQHAPAAERERNNLEVGASLEEWRMAWFAGDGVLIREELWPRWTLVHIVRLHFAYFSSLLMASPCVPSSEELVSSLLSRLEEDGLSAQAVFGNPPVRLVEAARTTFKAARIIRRGGLAWLMECLRFTVSATLVLLQGVIANPEVALAGQDLGRVDTWIEVFERLAEESADEYMGARTKVAARLRAHAAKACGMD